MGAALVRVGAHGPQHTYFEGDSGWIYGRQLREGRLAVKLCKLIQLYTLTNAADAAVDMIANASGNRDPRLEWRRHLRR